MARDTLTPIAGVINGQIAEGAGVAIVVANGMSLAASGLSDNIVLRVDNTTVSAKIVTIAAGVYPPAFRQGIGALAISVLASSKTYIFLESARFIQADSNIYIDFEAAMTGTVYAIKLPPELY